MGILIVSATDLEVAPLKKALGKTSGINFLITGVGMVACCYSLMEYLRKNKCDIMIQAGIGGSFDTTMGLADVVAIKADSFGDLGVRENGQIKSVFDLGLINKNSRPFKNGWLVNPAKNLLSESKMRCVNATTVNKISTNKKEIAILKKEVGVIIESMEGASFHYVGLMEKIPFIQFRSISNYAGERNKTRWKIKEAVENLNNAILQSPVLEIYR